MLCLPFTFSCLDLDFACEEGESSSISSSIASTSVDLGSLSTAKSSFTAVVDGGKIWSSFSPSPANKSDEVVSGRLCLLVLSDSVEEVRSFDTSPFSLAFAAVC